MYLLSVNIQLLAEDDYDDMNEICNFNLLDDEIMFRDEPIQKGMKKGDSNESTNSSKNEYSQMKGDELRNDDFQYGLDDYEYSLNSIESDGNGCIDEYIEVKKIQCDYDYVDD